MERATFKIEIPYTDHAHCIGRQGNQIQHLMSITNTHIHFPDGNRDLTRQKSNQVSITGTITSVEQARLRLKNLLPMSLKFLLPNQEPTDNRFFQIVHQRFAVKVSTRLCNKTGAVYCVVRGLINQSDVSDATEYLIEKFYDFQAPLISVTCQIEVNEQYQICLQTHQHMSLKSIEQYTQTKIQFLTRYERNTSVIISGTPRQVCQARKLFDLCLPISLNFEISDEKEPSRVKIEYMKEKFNVTIMIRTRRDKIGKLISIQTQEYNSEQLFLVRSMILDLSTLFIHNHDNFNVNLDSVSTDFLDVSRKCFSRDFLHIPTTSTDQMRVIPSESCDVYDASFIPITKKPSPIGYERSSLSRNSDQDIRSTSSTPSSDESFTLFKSIDFEKCWSTFDPNPIMSYQDNDRHIFSNNSTSPFEFNHFSSHPIDDINRNTYYFPSLSLLLM